MAGSQLRNPPVKFRHERWLHLAIDLHPACPNRGRLELWPRKWSFCDKSVTLTILIDLLTSTCRSTQVKIASTDLWPQGMFTFSEMLALVESERSFGAYVCHRRPGGSLENSDLVYSAERAGGPSSQSFLSLNQFKFRRSVSTYNNTLCPNAKSIPLPILRQRSFSTKDRGVNDNSEERLNISAKHRNWTAVAKFFAKYYWASMENALLFKRFNYVLVRHSTTADISGYSCLSCTQFSRSAVALSENVEEAWTKEMKRRSM